MADVSIVMPCHNHGRFLAESIEGILGQTYQDIELIVVDDHSADNSPDVILRYKRLDGRVISINHTQNLGASAARNSGLAASKGLHIAFCDADDVWEREKLEAQLGLLEKSHDHDVAYCDSLIIDEAGIPTGKRFSDDFGKSEKMTGNLFDELCLRNFINIQTVLARREAVEKVGGFVEGIRYVEDWLFLIMIAKEHKFIYLDAPFARYRVHPRSTAVLFKPGLEENRLKVFKEVIRRYPDISFKLKSKIFYEMGIECNLLGGCTQARKFFVSSFLNNKKSWRGLFRLVFPKGKLKADFG